MTKAGEWAKLIVRVIAKLILQLFHHFTYVTARSPTLSSLYLRHSSFSKLSVASPTLQLVLQPFRRFTYITAHCPNLPFFTYITAHYPTILSLLLRHRAHSPTFPSLHLRHSSFSNPFVALTTSQLILQTCRCFTYITAHSPTLLSLLLRHWLFTYVTWRAAHALPYNSRPYKLWEVKNGSLHSIFSHVMENILIVNVQNAPSLE